MLERIDFNQAAQPISIGTDQLLALSQMSPSQALAFGLSGGNRERMDELTAKVQQHLARWQTAA
jgi:hypothetical protein